MKKLMLFASALAGLFLAASCQKENIAPAGSNTVTYTVEAPGTLQTKAIADGTNVNELIYEVWYGSERLFQSSTSMAVDPADGKNKATVTLDLVNDQTYTVLFWAQVAGTGAYNTEELTAVSYAKAADKYLANDESLAAFYAVDTVTDGVAANSTVLLKRPFAQVNLCTLNERAPEKNPTDYSIALVNSKVRVDAVPTTFNVATKEVDNYVAVEFGYNAVPSNPSTITVNGEEYYYAGMNYVFAGANLVLTYDIQTSLNGSTNYATVNNTISEVPVKENYRTNIVGNLLTSKTDYEIIVDAEFAGQEYVPVVDPTSDALKAAIAAAQEGETIVISGEYASFPAVNKNITIVCEEGTVFKGNSKLNIAGATVVGATFSNPTGNAVDQTINGTFKNCTFEGVNGLRYAYAGETCVFENCVFSGSTYGAHFDGGANEILFKNCTFSGFNAFAAATPLVTFEGCTFVGNGKSAYNGANLWGSAKFVDTEFVFDGSTANEWVDAIGTDKTYEFTGCTINGGSIFQGGYVFSRNAGTKITIDGALYTWAEGDYLVAEDGSVIVATSAALNAAMTAATAGDEIMLAAGTYKMTSYKAGVKIEGADKESVIVDVKGAKFGVHGDVNIENVTLQFADANYTGFQHSATEVYTNCNIEGQPFLYGDNVTFNSCTFEQTSSNAYNVWTYGAKNVTFNGCTFNSAGKSVLVYAETAHVQNVTFNDCVLNASVPVAGKAAVEIDSSFPSGGTGKYTINLNNTVANGFAEGSVSKSTLWNIKKGEANCEVLVNGMKMLAAGVATEDGAYLLLDSKGLFWFADQVNVAKNAFSGKTVKLAADIDLANAAWTPVGQTGATTFNGVFDGQNHTISNLNVNSEAQTGEHYSSGLFGWVESHTAGCGHIKNVKIAGATVTGHHNCGALVGYITQETALVENCHVTGAAITCTKANADADGDKAGALIGNATVATPVKNCTAANSTVSAGRDAGQVIGAGKEANATGCSATDVAVSANGTSTGKNVRNEVIGRLL